MDETQNGQLGLDAGLEQSAKVYMPARDFSIRTRQEYRSDLEDLAEFLGARNITSWGVVGLRDLQHFMAELDLKKLAPSSRNRKTYAIKTFFRFLHQAGYIRSNPASELIPPTIPQIERRFLREEEYQALLDQAHASRDRAILEDFLQTGLRLSELTHLTMGDLELPRRITKDPENVGFLKVRRKRGKEVLLPLNWKACEALTAWLAEREQWVGRESTEQALFVSKFRKAMTQRAVRFLVEKYPERADIHGASVHTLRHTMATHYLAKGGAI